MKVATFTRDAVQRMLPCEQYSMDSLRLIGNLDVPPRPTAVPTPDRTNSAPVSLPALFFSWPNRRQQINRRKGGLFAGSPLSLLLDPYRFSFRSAAAHSGHMPLFAASFLHSPALWP
jgi:hypothetical protein